MNEEIILSSTAHNGMKIEGVITLVGNDGEKNSWRAEGKVDGTTMAHSHHATREEATKQAKVWHNSYREVHDLKPEQVKERLEHLRGELRAERISYGELAELQSLAYYIEPGDVELLEPAGVPEDGQKKHRFVQYVHTFYGADSTLYPMGATFEQIAEATQILIDRGDDVAFDSVDREKVRDIMIDKFGLVFPTGK
jgi:hypothetical protein